MKRKRVPRTRHGIGTLTNMGDVHYGRTRRPTRDREYPAGSNHEQKAVPKPSEGFGDHGRLVSVRQLAAIYGIAASTLYAHIQADPTFPYMNIGLGRKFLIDRKRFEEWLIQKTEREKRRHFGIPTALELTEAFKTGRPKGEK